MIYEYSILEIDGIVDDRCFTLAEKINNSMTSASGNNSNKSSAIDLPDIWKTPKPKLSHITSSAANTAGKQKSLSMSALASSAAANDDSSAYSISPSISTDTSIFKFTSPSISNLYIMKCFKSTRFVYLCM